MLCVRQLKLAVILGAALFSFSGSATCLSENLRAQIESASVSAAEHEDLDFLHLVQIRVKPKTSRKNLELLTTQLTSMGFRPLNSPEPGHPLIGLAPPDVYAPISRLKNVAEVRTSSAEKTQIWKNGARRSRPSREIEETLSDETVWREMPDKIAGNPPRDLETLREIAEREGVTYVISGRRPETQAGLDAVQELFGAKVFYADDLPKDAGIVTIPGVALHIGLASGPLQVRGKINFTLGKTDLYAKLNKVTEAYWVRAIDPNAMAPSLSFADVLKKHPDPQFEKIRQTVLKEIKNYLKSRAPAQKKALTNDLDSLVKRFFFLARQENPEGAFIKWKADYASRESDSIITSFSTPASKLTKAYLGDIGEKERSGTPSEVVESILNHPDDILIQKKLALKKTKRGNLMEFRVDVMSGHPVNAGFRFGMEYFPEDAQKARQFVQEFLDKLPPEQKYFSGGFDVAKLESGGFAIIETNPGIDSSMMDARSNPIDANQDLKTLLGKPTPLLIKLENTYREGLAAQVKMLKRLPIEPRELNSINKIPKYQYFSWLRERYLQDWLKAPSEDSAQTLLKTLRELIRDAGSQDDEDLRLIVRTTSDYMQRALKPET